MCYTIFLLLIFFIISDSFQLGFKNVGYAAAVFAIGIHVIIIFGANAFSRFWACIRLLVIMRFTIS